MRAWAVRLALAGALAASSSCGENGSDGAPRLNGAVCSEDAQCESGFCHSATCLSPGQDTDGDGLINEMEQLVGTDALRADTDGDGLDDFTEVIDPFHPKDSDGDGIIDALESARRDSDCDGIVDQDDPTDDPQGTTGVPKDQDGDGVVDYCLTDGDADGVEDERDCEPADPAVGDLCPTPLPCYDMICHEGSHCESTWTCGDGDPCTEDRCDQGVCTYGDPVDCEAVLDDGMPCSVGFCVDDGACGLDTASFDDSWCDDGTECTTGGTCQVGLCVEGEELDCDDKDPCTTDSCSPEGDCAHEPWPLDVEPDVAEALEETCPCWDTEPAQPIAQGDAEDLCRESCKDVLLCKYPNPEDVPEPEVDACMATCRQEVEANVWEASIYACKGESALQGICSDDASERCESGPQFCPYDEVEACAAMCHAIVYCNQNFTPPNLPEKLLPIGLDLALCTAVCGGWSHADGVWELHALCIAGGLSVGPGCATPVEDHEACFSP